MAVKELSLSAQILIRLNLGVGCSQFFGDCCAPLAIAGDAFIEMTGRDGTIDRLYAHWIHGEGTQSNEPRWSVIRDVLHWVE
jgi:hypothetical protein